MSQQWTVNDVEKISGDLTKNVEKIAGDLTNQLTHIAGQYGPQAWAAICGVKRVDSVGWLVAGVFALVAGIVIARFTYEKTKGKEIWKDDRYGGDPTLYFFIDGIAYATCIALLVFSASVMLNMWNWVGAFYPALAVVHDLIGAALAKAGVQ